ncbi:hypothetical protein CR513_19660, partial [Mucuna pruriens]
MGYGAISWASKKQPVVSLSITEAEYIATALCACQCIWLRRILEQLGAKEKEETVILCDNMVNDEVVRLSFGCSEEQVADIMTKPLKVEQFEKL